MCLAIMNFYFEDLITDLLVFYVDNTKLNCLFVNKFLLTFIINI